AYAILAITHHQPSMAGRAATRRYDGGSDLKIFRRFQYPAAAARQTERLQSQGPIALMITGALQRDLARDSIARVIVSQRVADSGSRRSKTGERLLPMAVHQIGGEHQVAGIAKRS